MPVAFSMVIAAVFSAPQIDTAESLVVEVVTTHMSVIRLANELTRNHELAELPGVNGAALRASFQPELDAYQQCIVTYFAHVNPVDLQHPEENTAKMRVPYNQWREAMKSFVDYLKTLPVTIGINFGKRGVSYFRKPLLPPMYGRVPFQTLFLVLEFEDVEGEPVFREETVDLDLYKAIPIETAGTKPEIILLNIAKLPKGTHRYPIRFTDQGGRVLGELSLRVKGRPAGNVKVKIIEEESDEVTSARVGLYGKKGFFRPSDPIPLFVHGSQEYYRDLDDPMWPSEDRRVFYTRGEFEMALPPGEYRLLVRKGIERHLHDQTFTVERGQETALEVSLKRWTNMPSRGWYSGDDHIHIGRDGQNNDSIMKWVQAEDIHVSNIVQMDDINELFFLQYAWGEQGMYVDGDYVLRSGQEGPRTDFRGHAIFYNLTHAIHDHASYYVYEDVFDRAHQMGGLAGYAHGGDGGAENSMSIDVPLGKVDFVEVMQSYGLSIDALYQFWNLGFQLTPTAGSDFPYFPTAGDDLVYVKVDGAFSFDAWFAGLKAGHTFVTNGPMLEFEVDRLPPGSEIALDKPRTVKIRASAQLNPTLDKLQRLEIVQGGNVVQTATATDAPDAPLGIEFELDVKDGTWIAARAYGEKSMGHTNAVYFTYDGLPSWNHAALPEALKRIETKLVEFEQGLTSPVADDVLRDNASRLNHYIQKAREEYSRLQQQAGLGEKQAP